jgi:hypothetical protein
MRDAFVDISLAQKTGKEAQMSRGAVCPICGVSYLTPHHQVMGRKCPGCGRIVRVAYPKSIILLFGLVVAGVILFVWWSAH